MKLYYSPGACSLSPHIVLRELELPFELVKVDLGAKKTGNSEDFLAINPKGSVPALQLDDGQVLTEGPVIAQYLADLKPSSELAPPSGTWQRVRLQEWLNYISTDIHKGFSPLFNAKIPDAVKTEVFKPLLARRIAYAAETLAKQDWLNGAYSIADIYLFVVLRWGKPMRVDLSPWPALAAFNERMRARAAVQAAIAAESAKPAG